MGTLQETLGNIKVKRTAIDSLVVTNLSQKKNVKYGAIYKRFYLQCRELAQNVFYKCVNKSWTSVLFLENWYPCYIFVEL